MQLFKLKFGKNLNFAVNIHLVRNVDLITTMSRFPADYE